MTSSSSLSTDNVLQFVLKKFITLQDEDKKYYVKHYTLALDKLLDLMKENDKLFAAIYRRLYFAGSYYDGLKVGKPEEFDLDVVMRLPINKKDVVFINKKVKAPFTTVKITAMEQLKHHPEWPTYRHMDQWTDKDGMLLQSPFREWMESVITKSFNSLPKDSNESNAPRKLEVNGEKYLFTFKKTGPAMTFNLTIPDGTKLDIDFVPVFEFKCSNNWPSHPVRENPIPAKDTWFIVPKPNSKKQEEFQNRYWRLAFHDQEREMINNKDRLKPVCRLLKMLKMLQEHIKERKIKYFWDDRYNLLSGMSEIELSNCEGRLNKIIKDIENKLNDDPKIIAKYILTPEEFRVLEENQAEFSRSPSVVLANNNLLPVVPANNTNQAANGTSLEAVMEILSSLQQELIQQKKLMQTVLAKVSILQNTVEKLTDDNALLLDELKLVKQCSKDHLINSSTDVDLLSFDPTNDRYCAVTPLLN